MSTQIAGRRRRWIDSAFVRAVMLASTLAVSCVMPVTPAQAATAALVPSAAPAGVSSSARPTQAATAAALVPSLTPDRLGAKAALTITIGYSGGPHGVPAPVRRTALHLPAGLSLDIPHLRSCAAAILRARGAGGCPKQSRIGSGHGVVEAHLGSQTITESITLSAFLGPPRNLQPTFEILAQGYTPFDRRAVLAGVTLPDRPPYGEELIVSTPPIPTLPLEPDASIVLFSLTIGTSRPHHRRDANTVLVPSGCPAGGFPFAAEFTYADGSSGSSLTTAPCP